MALMKLGSKSEAFRREGQAWHCPQAFPVMLQLKLEKCPFIYTKFTPPSSSSSSSFPLISRSGQLAKIIKDTSNDDVSVCALQLVTYGGAKAFELLAKFCYGVKIELTALNIVSLRCASEYLQMTDEYGMEISFAQTEAFLNDVLGIGQIP
ncbi:hypothetical protein HAX54_016041 [Datura stramonium]|uniref:BTB/POZ domain-containing protein n=1 Tax=Datura stramonium TaxID=4076 RepID=A0ABS8UKH6_DATST|nr:hypothetical protein [Datura stramonium]